MTNNDYIKRVSTEFPDCVETYDLDLIERLRNIYYVNPMPLSIVMLAHPMCVGYCHTRSIEISQAMPKFKLIRGDIKPLINEESPNHSWLEDDKYVYDTTDNCKWLKDFYYYIYEPKIIEIITEENCMQDEKYLYVTNQNKDIICNLDNMELMLEALELIEEERPTVNHDLLLNEISLLREKHNLKPKYYKRDVKSMSKQLFPDYYLSIKSNK